MAEGVAGELRYQSTVDRGLDERACMQKVLYYYLVLYMQKCPYYLVLDMQSGFYYFVLYMQSVLIIQCFVCKMSLLFSAVYAKCPYYLVLYMQSVLII